GMDGNTPAAVISNGGLVNHSVVRASLSNIYEESIKKNAQTPAIIVVGETAKFDYTYKNTKTVGIVSSRGLYEKTDSNLQDFGFETKWLCNMRTKRNESEIGKLSDELEKINQYEWIVFTSQNAMEIFFDEVKNKNIDFRSFHNIKFGVIGSGSNRYLRKYGFSADFIPSIYNIDSFSKEFVELLNNDKKSDLKIMILHAVRGNDAITKSLDENSISYKDFKIYDVIGEKYYDSLDGIDMLAFLSASGVEYFYKDEGNYLDDEVQKIPVACIGDSTARELEKYGKGADVVSSRMDVYGLSNAIADFYNKQ
ncbi:MAG: uroporphyrinogen-III synthase, partial [Lachnospiraceae bacterium]|nr:uroporphyrinogen-III synthase [Lachnospiraceae bacterium]